MRTSRGERDLIRDSGASLQIMNQSDLTPEGQETVQRSKDPPVVVTANGATRTTKKKQQKMSMIWTFLLEFNYWKNHPRYFRTEKMCEEKGFSCEWRPGQPSYLFKNGDTSRVKPTTTELWATGGSRRELWATTSDVIHGRINSGIVKFDKCLSGWRGTHLLQFLLPRMLQQHLLQINQEESTINSLIFPKTPTAKYADARLSRERHAKTILTIGRTELKLPTDLAMW